VSALCHRAAALDIAAALAQIAGAGALLTPFAVPRALEVLFDARMSPAFVHALCPGKPKPIIGQVPQLTDEFDPADLPRFGG